ncbi:glucokinase [Terrimonas alba]|uniref:glucokinase n=1 Tax=Terrimonas alba TaxID=3349636 RepID=UPI0035F24449
MLLPFKPGKERSAKRREWIVLAGDAGATKTNLSIFKWKNNTASVLHEAKYDSPDYKNIIELTDDFIKGFPAPDIICFGVAGPVLNGHAKFSNINWEIDSAEIAGHFGIPAVHVINDLEATAYGLAMLTEKDVTVIHKGDENAAGNVAIIAPGTGLGEAGLYWDGKVYHPFATEGGHCDFAARTQFDFELYSYLQEKFGHVSWERLVCGPGILNIYHFLRDIEKREEPEWLKEKINTGDAAATISRYVNESAICNETLQLFVRYLASESANLVLKYKATGGLFIAGGIVPQIVPLLENYVFYSSFQQSGRLNYLLEKVPVKIILNTKAPLLGVAYYACNN